MELSSLSKILEEYRQLYREIIDQKTNIAQSFGLDLKLTFNPHFGVSDWILEPSKVDMNGSIESGVSNHFYYEEDKAHIDLDDERHWLFLEEFEKKLENGSYTKAELDSLFRMIEKMSQYLEFLRAKRFQTTLQNRMVTEAFSLNEREVENGKGQAFEKMEMTRVLERAATLVAEKKLITPDIKFSAKQNKRQRTAYSTSQPDTYDVELVWSIGGDVVCAKQFVSSGYSEVQKNYVYQVLGIMCDKETYEQVLADAGVIDENI
jgi:hypothetical protein